MALSKSPLSHEQPLFAEPAGLSRQGKKAHAAVMGFLKRFDFEDLGGADPGGCKTFYSPEEWAKKGHDHMKGALLVVVYDGGDLYSLIGPEGDYSAHDKFSAHMEKAGFSYENGASWYGVVYPKY